jgi:hypothetical protein
LTDPDIDAAASAFTIYVLRIGVKAPRSLSQHNMCKVAPAPNAGDHALFGIEITQFGNIK